MSTRTKRKAVSAERNPRRVQSVDRALSILDLLASEPAGLALSDIAARQGMPVQTVQSLIRTLQYREMVHQSGKGAPYSIGPGLRRLTSTWLDSQDRGALARPVVAALADGIREYILLAELRGQAIFALVEARANRELVVAYEHCSTDRIHLMATGKVLLASLPSPARDEIIGRLSFRGQASHALQNKKMLLRHLAEVRDQDWARCESEGAEGVGALAVPVRASDGQVIAALGCSLPMTRFKPSHQKALLKKLQATAKEIEEVW